MPTVPGSRDGKYRLKTWPPKSDVLGITSPEEEADKWDTWEGPAITRVKQAGIGAAQRVNHGAATRGAGSSGPGNASRRGRGPPRETCGQGQLSHTAPRAQSAVEAKSTAARPRESAPRQTAPADDSKAGAARSTPGCLLGAGHSFPRKPSLKRLVRSLRPRQLREESARRAAVPCGFRPPPCAPGSPRQPTGHAMATRSSHIARRNQLPCSRPLRPLPIFARR